jgi:CRP-like cAMP-binding protein
MDYNKGFPIEKWDFGTHSIFSDLPEEDWCGLMKHSIIGKYKKDEIIFREGTIPTGIFYIEKGRAKKYKIDNFEKEQIFYIAGAGELIGYHAVLSLEKYPDSAKALEDCSISFIPKEHFLDFIDSSPRLSRLLLKVLSHEFTVLTNGIAIYVKRPVRERLAITLIVLNEKFKPLMDETSVDTGINLSREDLANITGTTSENVIRILSEFKKEGFITTKGRRIWVKDLEKLINASNYQ